jgi:hypothetical protein
VDADLVKVSAEELRGMTDEELVDWAATILGLRIEDADLVYKGDRIVGYKRGRLLTKIVQLAYLVEE